jgi:acetyl-CoA synthetase
VSVEPSPASPEIENLLAETRTFPPDPAFTAQANATAELHVEAEADFEAFWARLARERIDWFTPFHTTLEWDLPFAKWFTGGKLNISYNCLDRHVANGLGDKVAYHWVGEPGDTRTLTYADMLREVCQAANALKELGIGTGDRVAIYMPMIPELPIAMLACARLGAPHTVIFGGFSAEALQDRINDAEAKLVITADGGWRRGKTAALKPAVDEALLTTPTVEHTLVVRRLGDALDGGTAMQDGRDVWWHDIVDRQSEDSPAVPLDSEHMLYLLYTSGTTAKPKGIMHTTAGYLLGVSFTHEMVFDVKPEDVYWCAADVGWVTGHSYIVYGSLANATTSVLYEGTPDSPNWERWWQIIEDYKVSILYCAPTAIRAHMKQGPQYAAKHDLSSLRVLGTVGEPINPEAWLWYHEHIGGSSRPIVDTWWQTETGMIMITPLPGVTATKPGSATFPFPGIAADVVDGDGNSVPLGGGGYLVLTRPWPAMLRGIYGDPDRYVTQYWNRWSSDVYFTGDGAKRDTDGFFWLLGRVDDVLNVAGHRIGTMEVESALVDHPRVAEAAVVGRPHEIKGQAVAAFVTLKEGTQGSEVLVSELKDHVVKKIGAIARPDDVIFAADLPKTRSGKIMRRLLRDIAEGKALGDTTTLADPAVVARLKDQYQDEH